MARKIKAAPDAEIAQPQDAPTEDLQENMADSADSTPDEASLELSADTMEDGAENDASAEAASTKRRPLTPEQHQRKILRDRERRAMKSSEKAKKISDQQAAKNAFLDESLTQEERDRPYRQRLSAMIQAADAARFNRVMESQRRRAEGKEKSVTR